MKNNLTKEEIVELIGMADILAMKLKDTNLTAFSEDAEAISKILRRTLGDICAREYLDSLRNPDKQKKHHF